MRHVQKHARHDVEQEIPANGCAAQAQKVEHDVEGQHKNDGLHHVGQNRHQRISMRLSHGSHHPVVDQFKQRKR